MFEHRYDTRPGGEGQRERGENGVLYQDGADYYFGTLKITSRPTSFVSITLGDLRSIPDSEPSEIKVEFLMARQSEYELPETVCDRDGKLSPD